MSYGDLDHSLHEAVAGCDVVVHFAGHAHVPETPAGIEQAHRTNVMGTTELATACARSGVQRFVFISSALVLDGGRDPEGRIGDDCPRHPLTAYAQSKAEAEDRLLHVCEAAGMEWVVIRPPMVYGPQSPGNFQRLVGLVRSGVPIPLGRATAKRSFVFVDNLISAIQVAMVSPMARNETFVVGDDEVTSTAELLYMIGMQLGRPVRLLDLPLTLLQLAGSCVGRRADIDRVLKPLYVDASRIKRKLEWQPPFRLVEGVARSVG